MYNSDNIICDRMRPIDCLVATWLLISIILQLYFGFFLAAYLSENPTIFFLFVVTLSIILTFVLCGWLSDNKVKKNLAAIAGSIYGILQAILLFQLRSILSFLPAMMVLLIILGLLCQAAEALQYPEPPSRQ